MRPAVGRGVIVLLLGLVPAAGVAQDWSGASLRAGPTLRVPEGYRVEVLGVGFRLPQDLAFDPPDGLWVLSQTGRSDEAGTLMRLSIAGSDPVPAATLPTIGIPFSPDPARFRPGSLARHPTTGELFVAEQSGRHIFRVSPTGQASLYARGLNLLADTKALSFDGEARLLVLDASGRSLVADRDAGPPRDWFGDGERYVGPLLYRLRVDEPRPAPRNLEHAIPVFPPRRLREAGAQLGRYEGGVLALAGGDLILSGSGGRIDRLRLDGTITPVARIVPAGRVVAVDGGGDLYAVDYLGGRLVRVTRDGTVHRLIEGLARPAAVTVAAGAIFVAEDTGRILRIRAAGGD